MDEDEIEYLIVYEDLDKHYIVFEKNEKTRTVEAIIRFTNECQAYDYFDRLGLNLINPRDADWGEEDPPLF